MQGHTKAIKDISVRDPPPQEEQSVAYLITSGTVTKSSQEHMSNHIIHSASHTTLPNEKPIDIHLPDISIPSESEQSELSIMSLNKLYQTYTEATRLFPIYVKNMLLQSAAQNDQ